MKIAHIKLAIWTLNISLIVGISATALPVFKPSPQSAQPLKTEYVPEDRDTELPATGSNKDQSLSDYQAIWTKGVQTPPPPKPPAKPPTPPTPTVPKETPSQGPSINSLLRDYVIKGILINSNDPSENVVAIAKNGAQAECDRFREDDYLDGENVNVRSVQVAKIEKTKVFFKFNGKEVEDPLYFDPVMSGSNIVNYGSAVSPPARSMQTRRNLANQAKLVRPQRNPQSGSPQSAVIASPLDLTKSGRFEKRFTEADKTRADGMLVTFINPSSAFAAKGLQKGDVIKKINFKPVTNLKQMQQLFDSTIRSGARMISLEVERKGERLWLSYDVDPRARSKLPIAPSVRRPPRR